jgi:large subunit ribosomal protein L28
MAHRCALCGKAKPQSGNSVSFSQRHTKRRWRPNVQRVALPMGGRTVRMDVCTRCLRTLAKNK